jgi:clan AA aspartic protease (TIGR02281 family)
MGRTTESIDALKTALGKGYMDITHIEKDRDLDAIKSFPAYKTLIDEYRQKQVVVIKEQSAVSKDSIATISEVPMKKMYSGVYEIGCEVNGLPLKFVFDTGASAVTISSVEAQFMLKNGYLKTEDIKGKEYFTVATGEISEGTIIRLRDIKIGDAVLRNVEASVVHNQQAPLLLGQTVLERFGIITIDNINSKLVIKQ